MSYVWNAESEEEDTIIMEAPVRKNIRSKIHRQRSPKLEGQKLPKMVTFKSRGCQEILSELGKAPDLVTLLQKVLDYLTSSLTI